ncbi:MAG: DUF5688 family protein [Candidatus Limivivens sp.]|nr:DUF5688 family protein [Candidatus Limivivens sp.]
MTDSQKEYDSREVVKKHLIVRPVSTERFPADLAETVFLCPFPEVALVVYLEISRSGGKYVSTVLTKELAEGLKLPEKEIFRIALENTGRQQAPRIYDSVEDAFGDGRPETGDFMGAEGRFRLCPGPEGSTLTTVRKVNGAVALFLPGAARKIGEILQDDYFFTFPSIHFAKIHQRKGAALDWILHAAGRMRQAPNPEEYLSDQVYYYCRKMDRFGMIRTLE